ncbi:hypothetical protein IFR05_000077 [Cadophora sp. M221]|nr:hypothetical protein IFR05_000077 [Cadophora sp. M221]
MIEYGGVVDDWWDRRGELAGGSTWSSSWPHRQSRLSVYIQEPASHSTIDFHEHLNDANKLRGSSKSIQIHLDSSPPAEIAIKMISDDDLYRLAIFLGSAAMLLIILYHFLEINAVEEPEIDSKGRPVPSTDARAASVGR